MWPALGRQVGEWWVVIRFEPRVITFNPVVIDRPNGAVNRKCTKMLSVVFNGTVLFCLMHAPPLADNDGFSQAIRPDYVE